MQLETTSTQKTPKKKRLRDSRAVGDSEKRREEADWFKNSRQKISMVLNLKFCTS
jgi:hypothetical protein